MHSFVEASFQGDFPLRGLGLGEEIRASTAAKQTHTLQEEVREGERRQREETETYIHTVRVSAQRTHNVVDNNTCT